MLIDFEIAENSVVSVQPEVVVNEMAHMVKKDPGKSLKLEADSVAYLQLMSRDLDKTLTTIPIPTNGISNTDQ